MTEQIPFNTSPLPLRLRVEDFLLLDDGGAFHAYGKTELIGGEIFFVNAQHRPHMMAKGELAFRLRLALEARGSNLAVGIEGSFRLSDYDLPEPDILLTDQPYGQGPVPQGIGRARGRGIRRVAGVRYGSQGDALCIQGRPRILGRRRQRPRHSPDVETGRRCVWRMPRERIR